MTDGQGQGQAALFWTGAGVGTRREAATAALDGSLPCPDGETAPDADVHGAMAASGSGHVTVDDTAFVRLWSFG